MTPVTIRTTFRADAVELVRSSGRALREVGRELGVNHETLRNWVNAAKRAVAESFFSFVKATEDGFHQVARWQRALRSVVLRRPENQRYADIYLGIRYRQSLSSGDTPMGCLSQRLRSCVYICSGYRYRLTPSAPWLVPHLLDPTTALESPGFPWEAIYGGLAALAAGTAGGLVPALGAARVDVIHVLRE